MNISIDNSFQMTICYAINLNAMLYWTKRIKVSSYDHALICQNLRTMLLTLAFLDNCSNVVGIDLMQKQLLFNLSVRLHQVYIRWTKNQPLAEVPQNTCLYIYIFAQLSMKLCSIYGLLVYNYHFGG